MSSSTRNRKDVFSLKPLLAGLLLLLLGAGALGYYFIPYSVPPSVEQFAQPTEPEKKSEEPKQSETTEEPTQLETTIKSVRPDKTHPSRPTRPNKTYKPKSNRPSHKNPDGKIPETAEIYTGPPEIELTSPADGKTLVSSDPVDIEANLVKGNAVKVDFFYSRITASGISIYNTVSGVQIPNSPLVKLGSASKAPYRMENVRLDKGAYSIYGIVTDKNGISQISAPRTVFVNDAPGTSTDKKGWNPPLLVSNSTTCRGALVLSGPSQIIKTKRRGKYLVQGEKARFQAELNLPDENVRYKWRVTDGIITGGQGTASIAVDTTGVGGQTLIATVDLENDGGCRTSASGEAHIVQSPDSVYDPSFFEKEQPEKEDVRLEHRYTGCDLTRGKFNFITTLFPRDKIDLAGISEEFRERWNGELVICPQNKNRLLDENGRLRHKLGRMTGGIFGNDLSDSGKFTNGGTIGIEGEEIVWDLTAVMDAPGDYYAVFETTDECGGVSRAAQTVHIANYCRPCIFGSSVSNYEALEQDSPATIDLKIDLAGTPKPSLEKDLHFNWTTKGRLLAGQGTNTVTTGGWTSNEAAETDLDTKVEIIGLSAGSGVLTFTANLSNFDEIYADSIFRFRNLDPNLPVGEKTRHGIEELKAAYKKQLKYEWTLSGQGGKVIASGRKTGAAEIDLTGLNIPAKVDLSVKISSWNILFFNAEIPSETEDKPLPRNDLKCIWTVSTGTVLWGQGTDFLIVGDLDFRPGTPVTAEVECEGPEKSCPYATTIFSAVGRVYGGGGIEPPPAATPNYQSRGAQILSNNTIGPKHSSHKSRPGEDPASNEASDDTPQHDDTATHDVLPPNDKTSPSKKAAEHEFIKIAWPNEPVYVNQAFNVVVTYNRTTEALQIKDNTGEIVSELKSKELNRLIKERWGPNREVMAQMRLQSAALYQSETVSCSPNCQGDYSSLASDEQKWAFNVTAHNAGEHKFNLEMWIKPKVDDPSTPAEKVWSKEDLKLTVKAEMPTRLQIFASSGVLGIFGFVFLVRGVNLKVLIAGGDIVGGDKVGGHKVGGDMVGGDKIGGDKIDPGGGP